MSVEDELRALLAERAAGAPDNPARQADVHRRITAIRRHRVAGAALGLVLLAVAGLLAVRIPGTNESLPPGAPAPPYYGDRSKPSVRGYVTSDTVDLDKPITRPVPAVYSANPSLYLPVLLVARCERPGALRLRNLAGAAVEVRCRIRVGDHYEGALPVESARADELFDEAGGDGQLVLEPDSAGRWTVAVLLAQFPERLADLPTGAKPLLEGARAPGGGTFKAVVPRREEIYLNVECVQGVVLRFRTRGADLATVRCEPAGGIHFGSVFAYVPPATVRRIGLRPGASIEIAVERSGRDTDQWRVLAME